MVLVLVNIQIFAKGSPWKVAILTKMANLPRSVKKPANNSKLKANLMAVKNRQRVDENLNEASRGAPCKVAKLTKMANLGKISHGAW